MVSPLTSSVGFVSLTGERLEEPPEWTECFVELGVPAEEWSALRLTCNDRELPIMLREVGGAARVVGSWPRSGAGRYLLALSAGAELVETAVTTVRPSKLSETAYTTLLDDLDHRLPAAIAVGLHQHDALAGVELLPPAESTFEQELLRITRAVHGRYGRPGLASALLRISEEPHRYLTSSDVWVPRQRVRRLDVSRLPQLLTRPGNLDSNGAPLRVPEIRVEHTVDVYENRLLRTFHDQVRQRARALLRVAPTASPGRPQLEALLDELQRARTRARFLDDVRQLVHAPDRVTMVLLRNDAYRAAFEGFLEFRRTSAIRLHEPRLESPLENLPFLYQTWGVLQLLDVVLQEAKRTDLDLRADNVTVRHPSGLFIQLLRNGVPALVFKSAGGTVLRVIPQRTYGRAGHLRSVSFRQIPDVVLELDRPGAPTAVWVFDPKYKLVSEDAGSERAPEGRPVKLDIDAMHAYRDSIRDGSGARVVHFAAILYPGPTTRYTRGLEAIRAHPDHPQELRERLAAEVRRCLAEA